MARPRNKVLGESWPGGVFEKQMNATRSLSGGNDRQLQTLSHGLCGNTETKTGSQTGPALMPGPEIKPNLPKKRNWLKRFARPTAAVILASVTVGACRAWWNYSQTWVKTDNAYVAAHVHTVSARVAGTVQEVLADENQTVAAGCLLARLDPRDFEIRKQQAEAELRLASAHFQQAQAKLTEAQAQAGREQARAGKARLDLKRATSLFEGAAGAISKQEFDQAKAESEAADAGLQAAQAAVGSAQALVKAAQAQEMAVQANLDSANQEWAYTQIYASEAGRIGRKNVETGNRVQPGQPLLSLVEPEIWVTANFKETQLARMRVGQHVRIRLDAFPGRVFTGALDSFAPATGSQFALLPPDNATGNFTRIVQRVPVKIVLTSQDLGDCAGRIVPGMSAVVEVNLRG
jgi:membrane fusion protein, multidrug efflux system